MINAALNSWHMQVPDQLKRFVFLSEWTTVNPLLRPPPPPPPLSPTGGLFISSTFEGGGLIETGSLFNLAKTMVSVLHKGQEFKVEKLKYKKLDGGHASGDQNQIRTSSW